ncbi:MAG: metallopeptidase family protein [Candidatus Paceibacterota bacterium]
MNKQDFDQLVSEVGFSPVPEKFRTRMNNVVLIVSDEPDQKTREENGLTEEETLLGLYVGVPHTERGDEYGVGVVFPDTITLFRLPILAVAEEENLSIQKVVEDTIWHEVAHHFGLNEEEVRKKEEGRK